MKSKRKSNEREVYHATYQVSTFTQARRWFLLHRRRWQNTSHPVCPVQALVQYLQILWWKLNTFQVGITFPPTQGFQVRVTDASLVANVAVSILKLGVLNSERANWSSITLYLGLHQTMLLSVICCQKIRRVMKRIALDFKVSCFCAVHKTDPGGLQ